MAKIYALSLNDRELKLNYICIGSLDNTKLFLFSGTESAIKKLSGKSIIKISAGVRSVNRANKWLEKNGFDLISKEQSLDEIVKYLISIFAPKHSVGDFYISDVKSED